MPPGVAVSRRSAIVAALVLLLHLGLYALLREKSAPSQVLAPDGPVMEVSIVELQRTPLRARPVIAPTLVEVPTGALQFSIPDLNVPDAPLHYKKLERPVDLLPSVARADPDVTGSPSSAARSAEGGADTLPEPDPRFLIQALTVTDEPGLRIAPTSKQGWAGNRIVEVSVLVSPSGQVLTAQIPTSTGSPALDEAVLRYARTWRLKPGLHAGASRLMQATFRVAVTATGAGVRLEFRATP